MRTNSIMVIQPRWLAGTWVFTDETTGLVDEPFVFGVPGMIDRLVADIPGARKGFRLLFSASPFPGKQETLTHLREEGKGNWYRQESTGAEGWLCPALFHYFQVAPERIYIRAEGLNG